MARSSCSHSNPYSIPLVLLLQGFSVHGHSAFTSGGGRNLRHRETLNIFRRFGRWFLPRLSFEVMAEKSTAGTGNCQKF